MIRDGVQGFVFYAPLNGLGKPFKTGFAEGLDIADLAATAVWAFFEAEGGMSDGFIGRGYFGRHIGHDTRVSWVKQK